ncbi:MAG: CAP domain-containing protein [Planctomycetes bacterium]|nr:CAP domain-containing protein [Planctomycetota bacterium]
MMRAVIERVAVLAILVAGLALPLAAAERLSPASPEYKEMADLAKRALGPDADAADKAVDALKALGEPARPRLIGAVRELLVRGRTGVGKAKALVSDPAKAKTLEDEVAKVRAAAVANIARLAKDETLRIAHDNYDKLGPMVGLLNTVYEVRNAVRQAMARRPRLLALWQELGGDDKRFAPENEERLKVDAEAVLGMPLAKAAAISAFGKGGPPADPAEWLYWFHDACRRTEAYNRTLEPLMSGGEIENVRLLNAYREMLGILPLEVDARLVQSARRHSKEMVTLGYFAHESPTPANKTHALRMQNAGYTSPYSENIAAGSTGGRGVFWMWFDSPGHHQNMVNAGSTAIGVGAWASTWTQNFGTGRRLMGLEKAARDRFAVKGEILPPHGAGGSRKS